MVRVPARASAHGLQGVALGVVLIAALVAAGCGGSASPTAPSQPSGAGSGASITSFYILGSPVVQAQAVGYQFVAFVQYANLTSADVTASSTWSTSNPQIASFTSLNGQTVLQTFRTGVINVTAAYSGRTASFAVTVV